MLHTHVHTPTIILSSIRFFCLITFKSVLLMYYKHIFNVPNSKELFFLFFTADVLEIKESIYFLRI